MKAISFVFCCLALCGFLYAEGGDPWAQVIRHDGRGNLDEWGPDAFGYRAKSNADPGGPTPRWTDISSYGTQVTGLDDDNAVGPFPIGFNFHYYWYDVHQFWVGSNGYITFSSRGQIASPFPSLPNAALPNDVVAPYLTDWVFSATNTSRCYYWSNNTDTLIVMYRDVNQYNSSGSHNFEIILSGADSSITFQYGTQTGSVLTPHVGIENFTGRVGLSTLATPPAANTAVRLSYPDTINYSAHDMAVIAVQNPLSEGFFLRPGDTLHPWIQIANMGTQTESACLAHFVIRRPDNSVVMQFADTLVGPIATLDTLTIRYGAFYAAPDSGTFLAEGSISLASDSNATNDSMCTEFCMVNLPGELGYDDGAWDQVAGWITPNRATAVEFVPPVYPVAVTRTALFVTNSSGGTFDGVIYDDDGPGGSPGTELWRCHVTSTHFGWNTVAVPADSVIIRAGSFFVGCWSSGLGYGADNTSAHGIARRSWEYLSGWGQNKWWDNANVMIRCTVDQVNDPPGPFMRLLPVDSSALPWPGLIHFAWTRSIDPDGDSVTYRVTVAEDDHSHPHLEVTYLISDTTFSDSLSWIQYYGHDITATWTVYATDGTNSTEATNGEGIFHPRGPITVPDPTFILQPSTFVLSAYPNPFNSTATLTYDIPKATSVELKIINLVGEVVAVLHEGYKAPGRYSALWDASAQSSGTYFAVMKAGNVTRIQKLLLLK